MSHDFALKLWPITTLGVRVIVARSEVVPVDFASPRLFVPKARPAEPVASNDPERHAAADTVLQFAQAAGATVSDATSAPVAGETPMPDPLRGTVKAETPADVETTATTPASAPAPAAEQPAAPAPTPVAAPAVEDPPKPAPEATDPLKAAPATKGKAAVAQPAKRTGQVAVFVSRKEKKLYVRQGMVPLFDMPIEIEHPEQPLGTHVFTAMGFTDNGAAMRWNVMSLPPEQRVLVCKIKKKGQREQQTVVEAGPPATAAQALERVQIPQEAMDRIGEIFTPGSSLLISDQGTSGETGVGTDFIVLTH
jgi:hypothetical protein